MASNKTGETATYVNLVRFETILLLHLGKDNIKLILFQ